MDHFHNECSKEDHTAKSTHISWIMEQLHINLMVPYGRYVNRSLVWRKKEHVKINDQKTDLAVTSNL